MTTPDETRLLPAFGSDQHIHRDPWDERGSERPVAAAGQVHPVGIVAWLVPAMIMLVLGLTEVTTPSLWTDELATFGMVHTSWSNFVQLMHTTDAVNSPYYLFMIGWTHLAGTSDLALRLPSVLAMAGAAAMIGMLGGRLLGARTGLVAGLVFDVIPEISRYAQEARSYAFVIFAAVLATYLLMAVQQTRAPTLLGAPARPSSSGRRPSESVPTSRGRLFWLIAAYAGSVALLGLMNAVALLLLAAHAWIVIVHYRHVFWPWLAGTSAGLIPVLPFLWLGHQQKSQISWIPPVDSKTILNFPHDAFGATAIGVILFALALFALPFRRPTATFTAWAILPTGFLLGLSTLTVLYLPRYVLFTLPAWALLAGSALKRRHVLITALAIGSVLAIGVPTQLAVRRPDGHQQATRGLATVIAERERRGDAIVYGMTDSGGDWVGRATIAHYVPAAKQPRDALATRPAINSAYVGVPECTDAASCLSGSARVWVVRQGDFDNALTGLDGTKNQALTAKYRSVGIWHFTGLTLGLYQLK